MSKNRFFLFPVSVLILAILACSAQPSATPTIPDGASGFGVRLLNRMVAEKYED